MDSRPATFAGLATVVLAVRLLEPAAYGALAFGLSTAVVFAGVGRLGLEAAVARAIAIESLPGQANDVARGALSLVALTGIVGSVATFAVIELWARGVDNPDRTVLAVSLGLVLYGSNLAAVTAALARGGAVALAPLAVLSRTWRGRWLNCAAISAGRVRGSLSSRTFWLG